MLRAAAIGILCMHYSGGVHIHKAWLSALPPERRSCRRGSDHDHCIKRAIEIPLMLITLEQASDPLLTYCPSPCP